MRLFVIKMLLALATGSASYASAVFAADGEGTIQVGRQTRSFMMHVPVGQAPRGGFPVILAFHGGGMQGAGMARITGLNAVADMRRFIVVYPNGIEKHWNDGRLSIRNPQDDVGFVSVLLDRIEQTESVDSRRIYATGISNGALFTQRLGCALSSRVAAIAPVAGTIPVAIIRSCRPASKLAVLQIDSTADPIMPYEGGKVEDFGGRGEGGVVASVLQTTDLWSRLNGCAGPGKPEALPPAVSADPTRVMRTDFIACPAAGRVELLSIIGGGHIWPNGAQPYHPRITGQPSRQVDASKTIADFFMSLPPR